MAKVLLVEDDNNLREIYQARLMAEGYDIVTAQNGEEALVVAKQNKPDLIISDVMMPRISGFEMLDILRNTNELKHTKVIMLTALGQDDDQKRANNLGANRYLVKSQVTLEDIVNAAKELLSDDGSMTTPPASSEPLPPSMVGPAAPGVAAIAHVPDPMSSSIAPTVAATPVVAAPPMDTPPVAATPTVPAAAPAPEPTSVPTPVAAPAPMPSAPPVVPMPAAVTPVEPPAVPAAIPVLEPTPMPTPVPTPLAVVSEPTPTPLPPAPIAVVTEAAQGLEAEEAALQAQIASYAQTSAVDEKAATNASNDQIIADAVQQLSSSSEPTAASTVPMPAAVTPVEPPAVPAAIPVLEPTPMPTPTTGDRVPVSGKKVIQPISDPAAKPDLNALLAKEEAANPTPASSPDSAVAPPPVAASGTTPGQTFDPSTSL